MSESCDDSGPTAVWARFTYELQYEQLPEELIVFLKGLVLDTLGTTFAGSGLGDGAAAVAKLVLGNPGGEEATLVGHRRPVSVLNAAFANGAFAHALNYDALGRSGGHVGVASIPAPLALAERRGGVSGKDFIVAVALAAEFTVRLAAALAAVDEPSERFLEGQLLGYFGAAAGAARAARLSIRATHDVFGLALMQAAGSRQVSSEGGSAKAIYGAYFNHAAVLAVLLAELGLDAKCAALEGRAGLFQSFYAGRYDSSVLTEDLGTNYRALETNFKMWPTSERIFPFIRLAKALKTQHHFQPVHIRSVHITASPRSLPWLDPVAERRFPTSAATAANSIYFGTAKALFKGDVTLDDMTPDGLSEKEPVRLMSVISYEVDESLSVHEARMRVHLDDNTIIDGMFAEPVSNASWADLERKFHKCAERSASPPTASERDALVERVANLEQLADVRELLGTQRG